MTWSNYTEEKPAREFYESNKVNKTIKARMLYHADAVIDEEGDKNMTAEMKTFAEENYKHVDFDTSSSSWD